MNEHGISLIEALLVIVIVGSLVLLLANLPNALGLITKSKHISLAREIAAAQIEDKRTISYSNLVNDTNTVNDFRISLLPHGSGIVVVAACDPQICTNGENTKQVTVTITWTDNNKTQNMVLKTMISEGGINQ